jgi:hypothetical protein
MDEYRADSTNPVCRCNRRFRGEEFLDVVAA